MTLLRSTLARKDIWRRIAAERLSPPDAPMALENPYLDAAGPA